MHGKKIVGNSFVGIIYKILILLIGFVSRKIFIVYLGEEILGLNSLYANLLDLLNLADLGIGVAVQYQLYEPLVNDDKEKLSKILSATKRLYNYIGYGVLASGVVISFFIQYMIKDTQYTISYVRSSFIISVIGVAVSYFFVHKRLFLQANEQLGIVNIIDLISKVFVTIISLIATIITHNYFVYLIINVFYGIISNVTIHMFFSKKYAYLKSNCNDCSIEISELTASLKDVIPMKLTNYIYNSTDNIIISKVLGLSVVAMYSNYMTIINGIMGIEVMYGNVVTSSMGKIFKEGRKSDELYRYYLVYQYIQFIIVNFCTVSLVILCKPFITMWIGSKYVVSNMVFVLLSVDFFVHSMYQPAYVMYGAAGKFREDKYITLASAIVNIIVSIVFVNVIGLSGVIIGTIVSDIYIWILRSYQVVKLQFDKSVLNYGMKMIKYIIITLVSLAITTYSCNLFKIDSSIEDFILKIFMCMVIPNMISILSTILSADFKDGKELLMKIMKRG